MSLNLFFDEIEEDNKDSTIINEYKKWNKNKIISYLKNCDDLYHNGVSEISDTLYDTIKTYAKNKWSSDSYFRNIGSEKFKGIKITHKYVLGSLEKAKPDANDSQYIGKWLSKFKNKEDYIIITPKMDGLSLFVSYENGKLSLASTRGDGIEGQDITKKGELFTPSINVDNNNIYCFRGEILLTGEDHLKLGFKNRRNGASGLVGSDSLENCEKLKVIYYEYIDSDFDTPESLTEEERLISVKNKFPDNTIWWIKAKIKDISPEYLIDILNKWNTEYSDVYDFDGLVLTLNNSIRENVYIPENKISFKFNEEKAIACVDEVKWETSRTGRVVPVVILKEAVELSGASVQKATGYNAKFILDNKIKEGRKIEICRSGNVIPKILNVIED